MAIANVQIKSGTADDTASISITPDSNVTAGNLLIVYAMKYSPSNTDVFLAGDLTKSAGTSTIGTVTLDVDDQWGIGSEDAYAAIYSIPITGSGSLTLQITGDSGCWFFVVVQEVSGADTSGTRLAGTNEASDNTSPYDSGTVALTGGGIFCGAVATLASTAQTFTEDAAFTLAAEQETVDHMTGAAAYRIVTTDTTDSATWTSSHNYAATIVLAVYKESSGPVTLTVSKSESITVSESVSVQVVTSGLTVSKAESVTVSESRAVNLPNALTVSKAESVTVSESRAVAFSGTLAVSKAESVTLSEGRTVSLPSALAISKSESITVSEARSVAISGAATLTVSVADAVFVVEPTFVGFETPAVSVSESITVSESRTVSLPNALAVSKSENVTVGEVFNVASAALVVNKSESITVSENASIVSAALAVSKTENITVSEAPNVTITEAGTYYVSPSEGISVSENVSVTIPALAVSKTETITITDTGATSSPVSAVSVADGVTVSEGKAIVLPDALAVSKAENVTVSEAPNVTITEAGMYYASPSEGISVSDSVSVSISELTVSKSEAVTVTDVGAVSSPVSAVSVADGVSLTEMYFVSTGGSVTLSLLVEDRIFLSEIVRLGNSPWRSVRTTYRTERPVNYRTERKKADKL